MEVAVILGREPHGRDPRVAGLVGGAERHVPVRIDDRPCVSAELVLAHATPLLTSALDPLVHVGDTGFALEDPGTLKGETQSLSAAMVGSSSSSSADVDRRLGYTCPGEDRGPRSTPRRLGDL